MTVSIIIPCHNAAPYLAQTIGSALEQTHLPHEIIIVDDASTDGSLDVARRFQCTFPQRVHVIAGRWARASRARNVGARAATGEAVMFLDADDVLAPNALEALTVALVRQPDAVALCPWYRLEQAGEQWLAKPPTCVPRRNGQDPLSAWLRGWYHPPCSVLWSRVALERTGDWDEHLTVNDDGDLMMRALAIGTPLVEAPEGAAYYRRLPPQQTSLSGNRLTPHGLRSRLRAIEKIATWLANRGTQHRYRGDLRRAFDVIAADANGCDPDVKKQAEAQAQRYAPPVWARAGNRLARVIPRARSRATPARQQLAAEPVEFGLATARHTMSVAPAPAPSTFEHSTPPRLSVTVIVPTYNRAALLPRALDSVLAQTFHDFELLVIDDGSTDDTSAGVARYGDGRLRYLRQQSNAGVAAARNRGLREARGEFIAFLDSDDEWMPEKLARQVEQFRDLPDDVGLTYTGVETVFDDGVRTVERPTHRGDVYETMLLRNVIHGGGSNGMIRRGVVATVGFFDEGMPAIEDYDYWLRITRFFKVDFIDEPLMRYHDPRTADRRSLAVPANLAARAWLYRKHKAEMRRVGVANAFLRESIRRAMTPPHAYAWQARLIAGRAFFDAPSRETLGMLRRTLIPRAHRTRHDRVDEQRQGPTRQRWSNA